MIEWIGIKARNLLKRFHSKRQRFKVECKTYLTPVPKRINQREVIVSLASWSARYHLLPIVLNRLLRQRFKVDRILLWLDEGDEHKVPEQVFAYQNKGVEIRFTKNIGSYKKLIPALNLFPEAIIITVDDDVLYPVNLVSELYRSYCKYPNKLHANRCRKLERTSSGGFLPYEDASVIRQSDEKIGGDILFTGVSGVLYPNLGVLHDDALDEKLFMELAPKQDDIWFWYMAFLNGSEVCKIENNFELNKYMMIDEAKDSGLWMQYNKGSGKSPNDIALENLNRHYNS